MSILPGVLHKRQTFTTSADAPQAVVPFAEEASVGWDLPELVAPLLFVARELVAWVVANGSSGEFAVTLTYDEPIVHIEVKDRGALIPNPYVSRADAELAVRLLARPAIEWGAELDSRGRTLWVSFSARRSDQGPAT
jgi:hypothetical protein